MQEAIQESTIAPSPKPKTRYSAWFKLLAVLVALAGALVAAYALLHTSQLSRAFEPAAYQDSEEYYRTMGDVLQDARYFALEYRSDGDSNGDYAAQENVVREASLQRTQALQARYQADISQMVADAQQGEGMGEGENPLPTPTLAQAPAATAVPSVGADQPQATAPFTSEMLQRKEQLDQELASENASLQNSIDSIRQNRRANDERAAGCEARLKALDGILYAAVAADSEITTNVDNPEDIDQLFHTYEHRLIATQGQLTDNPPMSYRYSWPVNNVIWDMPAGSKLYVAMTPEKFRGLEAEYGAQRKTATDALLFLGVGGLVTLAGLAWLLYAAGRKPAQAGVVLIASDWLYLDVQLAVLIGIVALCGACIVGILNSYVYTWYVLEQPVLATCFGALLAVMLLFTVLFLTSAAKRAKRGELLRHTLIFTVLRGIWRGLKSLAIGLKVSTRYVLAYLGFVILYWLLAMGFGNSISYGYQGGLSVFLFLLGFVMVVVAFSFVLHKVISFKNLSTAVRRIQAGELGVRVPTGGGTDLAQLAHSINNLADGLKAAVDNEVKSERMRAELVTNVSHDLKTPLTSIVTYVDLLKTEGLTSENAPHYLDVIDQKAARLKTLTADLFEAAKAASGTMPVNLERVDANALLAQGLSELSDRILASGLDMKLQLPADRLLLRADGRLLWRVMENLLSNVFKYALKGSRVYLSATRLGGRGVLTLKNISAYELNIAPEELTERFTRGDASRHSEGSGLGLSIARSLAELQGGEFRIEIDGDLFKVMVSLPVWEE